MKILVTGATGNVGSGLVPRLVETGHAVRVLTRSPYKLKDMKDKVEIALGSLADAACLEPACAGIDAMFLLTPQTHTETEQGLNGVHAAQAAGVKRLVYMSAHRAESAPEVPHYASKLAIKAAVRSSGIEYTFIEPSNFFQTDLWIEDPIRMFNVYPQPLGSLGVSRIDLRDIADAAVKTLTEDGHGGESYPLVGMDPVTGPECARIWTTHLERQIDYVGDDLDNWEKQAELLMPPWLAHDLRIMYEHFQRVGLLATLDEHEKVERLLGRKPRRYFDFVGEVARLWK